MLTELIIYSIVIIAVCKILFVLYEKEMKVVTIIVCSLSAIFLIILISIIVTTLWEPLLILLSFLALVYYCLRYFRDRERTITVNNYFVKSLYLSQIYNNFGNLIIKKK